MKLPIVIPCDNERSTIGEIAQVVRAAPYPDKAILIGDGCSTDGTRDILRGQLGSLDDRVLHHDVNLGNGAARRTGMTMATGDIVITQDTDLEYDPSEYPRLVQPIPDGKAHVARHIPPTFRPNRSPG